MVVVGLDGAQAQAVGLGHDVPARGFHREEGEKRNGGGKEGTGRTTPRDPPPVRRCHDGVCDDAGRAAPRRLSRASQARGAGRVPAVGCHQAAAQISGSRCPRKLHSLSQPLHLSTSGRQFSDTTPNEELPTASQRASRGTGAPTAEWRARAAKVLELNVSINPQQPRETRDPGPSAPYSVTNRI